MNILIVKANNVTASGAIAANTFTQLAGSGTANYNGGINNLSTINITSDQVAGNFDAPASTISLNGINGLSGTVTTGDLIVNGQNGGNMFGTVSGTASVGAGAHGLFTLNGQVIGDIPKPPTPPAPTPPQPNPVISSSTVAVILLGTQPYLFGQTNSFNNTTGGTITLSDSYTNNSTNAAASNLHDITVDGVKVAGATVNNPSIPSKPTNAVSAAAGLVDLAIGNGSLSKDALVHNVVGVMTGMLSLMSGDTHNLTTLAQLGSTVLNNVMNTQAGLALLTAGNSIINSPLSFGLTLMNMLSNYIFGNGCPSVAHR